MMSLSKKSRSLKSVRTVIISGSVISEDFIEKAKFYFPNAKIVTAYASTEGGVVAVLRKELKGWSSGKAANGCQIKVIKIF